MEKESEQPAFDITDRGYNVKAWYLKGETGDALIEITKDGALLRSFTFPAYKIWNIAAHFKDIVDGELESSDSGYQAAASTGIGPGTVVYDPSQAPAPQGQDGRA